MSRPLSQAACTPLPLSVARVRSFWPSKTHEALLRAALAPAQSLEEAVQQWRSISSLDRIDYPSLTILPLLYHNLCRHECRPDLRSHIKGVYRWSWHRNQLLVAALRKSLAVLRNVDVEATVMKGVPLALRVYPSLGTRVMGDADVIVRRGRVAKAIESLASAGWTAERHVDEATIASLGGVNLRDDQGRCIDLHWHVLPDHYDDRRDEDLLERAVPIKIGEQPISCLSPADHLLEVLCHGFSWAANAPIHWVTDASFLLDAERDGIDWDRFVEQARLNRCVHAVRAALRYLASTFEAPVPRGVLERLDRRRAGVTERAAFWFVERSDGRWAWGRVLLVAALFVRSSRARGRWPGPVGFVRFASTRADCTPSQWLRLAAVNGCQHVGRFVSNMATRLKRKQEET